MIHLKYFREKHHQMGQVNQKYTSQPKISEYKSSVYPEVLDDLQFK